MESFLHETSSAVGEIYEKNGGTTKGPLPSQDGQTIALAQLVLAEKRTSLAVLRTGVTMGLVPLSITTVLITLSRFYHWLDNLHFLIPMYVVLSCLALASLYMVARALRRIRHQDKMLDELRHESRKVRPFLE